LQSAIWADKLPQLQASRSALQRAAPSAHLKSIAQVWTATFSGNGRSYVVSAINDGCESSSAAENALICPVRIAEVVGGKVQVVADTTLPISSVRGNAGYDASSNANSQYMTIASFDPVSRAISFTDVSAGQKTALSVRVNLREPFPARGPKCDATHSQSQRCLPRRAARRSRRFSRRAAPISIIPRPTSPLQSKTATAPVTH
jgi:hypothetical protein